MDHLMDVFSKIVLPCAFFFFGLVLNWIREDLKGIRAELSGIRKDVVEVIQKLFNHAADHAAHCKHPLKGC